MKIADITLSSPVMNAACSVAKSPDDILALSQTRAGIVLIGSITLESREGNPEPRWFVGDNYALNSFGMPNNGAAYYAENLPEMISTIHSSGKKVALSIAGFSTDEYVQLAEVADKAQVDFLELNLGCPNVRIDGAQKPIVSFDSQSLKEIVEAVSAVTSIPLFVKLSPYSNPADLGRVAETIKQTKKVAAVVTCNTFPNGLMFDESGEPVIASELAGVSGQALKPIALGQVRQFRKLLPETIVVIGVGGIETKEDVQLFMEAGAAMVQVATLIVRDGHSAIDRLL